MYDYLQQAWKKPSPEILRKRMIEWRKSNAVERVEKPLRLDRARTLGYKAKPGIIVARVRLFRGGRKRPKRRAGRKPRNQRQRKVLSMNYRWVAEARAAKRYPNLEVLNSYWIGKDGIYYFFEVILVDPSHPQIRNDPILKRLSERRGRVFRGLTSAGRESRGLRAKGRNAQF